MPSPDAAFRRLIQVLTELKIPFYICGSIASSARGVMRATLDVDLVAAVEPAHIAGLVAELGKEFYADPEMMRHALSAGRSFNLIHYASAYKFDIFPLGQGAFEQAQFARRAPAAVSIEGSEPIEVPVASAEDTLLSKLSWFRTGGEVSDKQWNDIRGIADVQRGKLDLDYLQHWAAHLKVSDLLDRVLTESRAC